MSSTNAPRLAVALLLVLFGMAATGCASVLSRTHQTVQLQSDTEGTTVVVKEIDTKRVFGPLKTPAWATLSKGENYIIEFTHPEGEVLTFQPQRTFDPITLINILGLLGFIADIFTGAVEKYDSKAWSANFEANQVVPVVPSDPKTAGWNEGTDNGGGGETDGMTGSGGN